MGKSHLTDGYSSGGEKLTVWRARGMARDEVVGTGGLGVSAQTIEAE